MNAPAPSDPAVVPARPAATVVIVRDNDHTTGVEIFMLRRTANAAFAADMYVFPGGRVDDVDGAAELEPYCDGLDDATASRMLGIDHGGLAYWVAAVVLGGVVVAAVVYVVRRRSDGGPPLGSPERERSSTH